MLLHQYCAPCMLHQYCAPCMLHQYCAPCMLLHQYCAPCMLHQYCAPCMLHQYCAHWCVLHQYCVHLHAVLKFVVILNDISLWISFLNYNICISSILCCICCHVIYIITFRPISDMIIIWNVHITNQTHNLRCRYFDSDQPDSHSHVFHVMRNLLKCEYRSNCLWILNRNIQHPR